MTAIVRAQITHTPKNPFVEDSALEFFEDGGVAFDDGRILACGPYQEVRSSHPEAEVQDARDALLLPGLVDCHVHYPQIRVIGAMGLESPGAKLGAFFTLAREESIAEVRVGGRVVWPA